MGLSIKNEETERLVKQLADLTGETQTGAVTEAVRERIARLERDIRRVGQKERILAIADAMAADLNGETLDVDGLLYDPVTGLPK